MQEDERLFLPPRRNGLILHAVLLLVLLGGMAVSLWLALQQQVGGYLVLLIALSVVLTPPAILVAYRGYALLRAGYALERDGLKIRWGLRIEDIPIPSVEWVRPANEMGFHMPLPRLQLPGSIVGVRNVEGLGPVEYMASDRNTLLLIATPERIYAISPASPSEFMRAFQRTIELGSISPIPSYSSRPAAFLQSVWSNRLARSLLIASTALTLALFIMVSLMVPGLGQVSLGFDRFGVPLDRGPAERLLLLPVLAGFTLIFNIGLGLFFYRMEERISAYLLWASSATTPLLLIIAAIFLAISA